MSQAEGDIVFETTLPGADRERLRQFSAGTEDPNPIHVDDGFARAAGFDHVLQQGPMTTAHFARLMSGAVGQDRLGWLDVTFLAPVYPDEALTLRAVTSVANGEVICELSAAKADGTPTAKGEAAFRAWTS